MSVKGSIVNATKTLISLALAALVIGCSVPRQPVSAALVPDDCANKDSITFWLEDQINGYYGIFPGSADRNDHVRGLKERLWSIRYHCQRNAAPT
jgi:Zn ribbon nucleic-acid-binding protein